MSFCSFKFNSSAIRLLLAIFTSFLIQCLIAGEGSSINGHDKSLKKGLSIDLNEDYVPGNSPESSPSRTEQARSSTPIIEQPQTLKGKKYIYIPRKTENQYSQSEAAQISRKMMKFLRENDKDGHQKYLAKERVRLAKVREKDKEISKQYGRSMRPHDYRLKEARANVKKGTANEEEKALVKKKNEFFKEYRASMKKAGIPRNQNRLMSEARERMKQGKATKEDFDRIEKKRLSDRVQYYKKHPRQPK